MKLLRQDTFILGLCFAFAFLSRGEHINMLLELLILALYFLMRAVMDYIEVIILERMEVNNEIIIRQ